MTAACPDGCFEVALPETWTPALLRMLTCPDCQRRLEVKR